MAMRRNRKRASRMIGELLLIAFLSICLFGPGDWHTIGRKGAQLWNHISRIKQRYETAWWKFWHQQ